MSKMDVERLMRDLTIDQLTEIQNTLSHEGEQKKEELRQMVGRRYRDVLEASNTVRRLTEIADTFVDQLKTTREVASQTTAKPRAVQVKKQPVQAFVLLNSILPLIGDASDGLMDVFCLLLAENLHRTLSMDPSSLGADSQRVVRSIGDRLVAHRLHLDGLLERLGDVTDWQVAAGELIAVALSKQTAVEELLDVYLKARQDAIDVSINSSTSLIGIITMIRETVRCVDDLFGHGQGIYSAFHAVTSDGWCPEAVESVMHNQLHSYERLLRAEISKVNAAYTQPLRCVDMATVQRKCTQWMNETCSIASKRIKTMCDYFERTSQMLEFVVAINEILKADWPSIAATSSVYQNLFGNSLVERFRALMTKELLAVEEELLLRLPKVHCNPPPLFHKRAVKFDSLLATGVSQELHELVQHAFEAIKELLSDVNKYVRIGREANAEQLLDALADAVLEMVSRITAAQGDEPLPMDLPTESTTTRPLEERERWLTRFRLYLALVQHEPSVLCQCMNGNAEKIVACNKTLHAAAENALCHYVDHVVVESVQESQLSEFEKASTDPFAWIDYLQEREKVPLEEAGSVEVPIQLSRPLFLFLYAICRRINQASIGHLFTRNRCASQCSAAQVICAQLLFDCKALFLMFLDKAFIETAKALEAKLDPFELSVLSAPLSKNAKLFVQRTSLVFGQFQVEHISASSKDTAVSPSYSAVVDIAPRMQDVPRLTLIPRLSKLKESEEKALGKRKRNPAEGHLQANMPNKAATSSFSSLYDKISSGWFKG